MTRALLRDLYTALAAALLVTAAVLVGRHIQHSHHTLFVNWPPLLATWDPHVGPGTPAALVVGAAGVAYGPTLAARLPWRALLAAAWATATAWIASLALIDGWRHGIAGQLTSRHEYLQVIERFDDIPSTLRDFTRHILLESPDNWPAHVAGHPPAAPLTFVLLDRMGLRGGGWAGTWCIAVGATACVAVLVAVRALASESLARRAAPFLVLAPAAVWMGTSADAYFAAVAAWAVALLALAVSRRSLRWAAAAGLLFGLTCYLSYGLTLVALIGSAVLLLGRRHVRERPTLLAVLVTGLAVVPVAFTLAGFDWWEAYHLLVKRYYQGVGGIRPYGYWVWANLACTVLITGLATPPGLRRAGAVLVRPRTEPPGHAHLALLVASALLALLVADLSGMSKAETERIWLPFAVWLLPACAFLSRPRVWLTAQAVLALLLNHLLLTGW
ncbi:glycosyltransferase family 39 protein [Streptomyces chartreusis]|uniref:Glycosyltransferase family 39 protein n=1 Tax=Streptomyces chartreusis TaxID=1969 RepID=A0A7H8T4H2_STRCX|nr:glycosyltransferase family 39 protein [Streptomyces chartreusis]QKZ18399.1 glycosyltransferase family 39 protein [Streptomyces chartreusis]